MMKRSITTLCPVFNTGRMVAEYMTTCYLPSAQRFLRLAGDNLKRAGGPGGVAARPGARLAAGPACWASSRAAPTRCTSAPSCR